MLHPFPGAQAPRRASLLRIDVLEGREAPTTLVFGWEWMTEEPTPTSTMVSGFETSPSRAEPTPNSGTVLVTEVESPTSQPPTSSPDDVDTPATPQLSESRKAEIRVGRGGGIQHLSGGTSNQAPIISNFAHQFGVGGICTFTGQVTDETPGGLTIRFGGYPNSLQGKTTTTEATGAFTYSIVLLRNGTDTGVAEVQTTDPQGLDSNVPNTFVQP